MSDPSDDRWERFIAERAARFAYPPTPDMAERVRDRPAAPLRARRLAAALAALLLLFTLLLAVPEVRAAVAEWLHIGAVRIQTAEPADLKRDDPRTVPDLAGATTWQAARQRAGFPLRLPAYPDTLGAPDEVYLQEMRDPGLGDVAVITIWRDRGQPALALYQVDGSQYALKAASQGLVSETTVHGERAYWVSGPHWLQLAGGELAEWLFVEGDVLVWVEGTITYRLEGAGALNEAVRIAESLE